MPDERFVNQAYLSVVESGANTATFSKLETGISIYEKVGWLITRIDYNVDCAAAVLTANALGISFGISSMDGIASPSLSMSQIIDYNTRIRSDYGAAASGFLLDRPWEKDFSALPGGGLLVPPNPLYLWAKGIGLAAAQTILARMFYTVIKLKTEDFWELVEQRRMIGA